MKYVVFIILGINVNCFSQAVGINTDGSVPDPSSILDIKSTSAGILVPRMTSAQRSTILSPADGLMVYDTDLKAFFYYNTSNWQKIGGNTELSDQDNDTKVLVEATSDEDSIKFMVEGYEFAKLDGKTFHLESPSGSVLIGKHAGASDDGNADYNAIAIGNAALYNNSVGAFKSFHSIENIAIGNKALFSNTIGERNTGIGYYALENNINGGNNIAIGTQSMSANINGDDNVALGSSSLTSNTYGTSNTALGHETLINNTTGNYNVAVGLRTLFKNTSGTGNIGHGTLALYDNETGSYNAAMGYYSLTNNVVGENNVALGKFSLRENLSGDANVAIGNGALNKNTTKSGLVAIGDSALYYNGYTSNGTGYASENTAIGSKSLMNNDGGDKNTGVGFESLEENVSGRYNTGVGYGALNNNISGQFNTGIGSNALDDNISGLRNTGIGSSALSKVNSGSDNVSIGAAAMLNVTTSHNNVAVGSFSGYNNTGSENVIIGKEAAYNNTSGDNNTIIGYNAGRGTLSHAKSGSVMIGYEAGKNENSSNKLYIDNSSSSFPLIYGDFNSNLLRVNGTLEIGTAYKLPINDGANGESLTTDGSGNIGWTSGVAGVLDRTGIAIHPKNSLDDDFILGNDELPLNGVSISDTLLFFDESKGAFRSGVSDGSIVGGKYWSPDSIGIASFSFGSDNLAKGKNSGGWGSSNQAIGANSTSFGQINNSYGFTSTSWGGLNDAIGSYSTVWGSSNIAPSAYETALGRYATTYNPSSKTTWSNNDRLFVIGNGSNPSTRSNALAIMKNGDTYINGEVLMQGQDNFNKMRLYPNVANGSSSIFFGEDDLGFRGMEIEYDGIVNQLEISGKNGSTINGPHLTINRENGNMTIGNVEATGHKLSVDGKVACEEVLVELSGNWPDYVFESDYNLLTLEDLSEYISEHKHLPGIKPANEVESQGLQLGESNRMLMEKVEELTLYIIQMNEQNKVLIERIENLEKK